MQLAPNGKIYMSCTYGTYYLHIIHNPDGKGQACDFRQHDIKFPNGWGSITLPKFPNYRLYDYPNSPCDTLGIDDEEAEKRYSESMNLYPNPSDSWVNIELPHCTWELGESTATPALRVYDMAGRLLYEEQGHQNGQYSIDVSLWAAGVYVAVYTDAERREVRRFVVGR